MHSGGVAAGVYRQPTVSQANGSGTVSSPSRRPRKRERPPNYGAQLLSAAENQTLFSLLGHDCISLAAGVVQLLKADPDNPRFWTKVHVGVISLVKDYEKRAYFLRLYEIFKKQFTWEQMLYKNFRVSSAPTCPNLLSFEGDECVYGVNFSSREEAINFKHHLDKRYEQEQRSPQKGSRSGANGVSGAATTLQASGHQYPSLQNRTGITSMGAIPNVGGQLANLVSSTRSKKKSTKKDKKTRIRKEDISNPTNFLHKVHVGWDQDGGFSQETYDGEPMDESILTLLRAAGQNPDRMTKEDLDFSYRFITDYQKTTQSPVVPPPPPPLMQQNTQRSYHPSQAMQNATSPPPPPPPPIRREASLTSTPPSRPPQRPPAVSRPLARPLPTPPSLSSGSSYRPNDAPPPPPPPNFAAGDSSIPPPPPPPPPTIQTGGVAPPPPPPPPPIGPAPALPPPAAGGRANLLNEIHAGIALRPVSMNAQNDNNNVGPREDVMAQIRQGANLKPVDKAAIENRKSTPNIADVGGIAGALARALEERRRNMHNSDDSEEEEAENNDSEWETD